MPKLKIKKKLVRPIHLQAIIVLVICFLITNFVFVSFIANNNVYISFFGPLAFGVLSSFVFLYLFSHKGFFPFIGKFEKEENKKEKGYLDKFIRYGKLLACILIGAFGGPIFLALTVRFLFTESENRYLIALISVLISTIFMVAFAKGLFSFLF